VVDRFPAEIEKLPLATVVGALAQRKLRRPRIDTVQQEVRNRPQ
jgi:hypothetical protein